MTGTPTNPATSNLANQQPSDPAFVNREFVHRAAWKAGVIGAMNALALVLAARFAVLVAIVGGIVLTAIALTSPDPYKLGALAIYAAFIVPTIWLAGR